MATLLISRRLALFVLAALLFASGCTTYRLVPAVNGGRVAPDQRSITQAEGDVTITLAGPPFKADLNWIESVVTPIYAVIQNNGSRAIELRYQDFIALDERRVQYPALPPETVATRAQSIGRTYITPPPLFIGRRHVFNHSLGWWYDPWPYYPDYMIPNVSEIFAEALPAGRLLPHARAQGLIYFNRLPTKPQQITIVIGYELDGARREMTFPFAVEANGN